MTAALTRKNVLLVLCGAFARTAFAALAVGLTVGVFLRYVGFGGRGR